MLREHDLFVVNHHIIRFFHFFVVIGEFISSHMVIIAVMTLTELKKNDVFDLAAVFKDDTTVYSHCIG